MLDVDSFILQSRSAYEIVGKFLKAFFVQVFGRQIDQGEIRKAVEERGVDWTWTEILSKARKEFFQSSTGWYRDHSRQRESAFESRCADQG